MGCPLWVIDLSHKYQNVPVAYSKQLLPHGPKDVGVYFPRAGRYSTPPQTSSLHDDVIKWKHLPRYWPFVGGIHQSPVNSPHKGQWRGALMFSLICILIKRLSKQSWGWWFETLSRPLWRHCNGRFEFFSSWARTFFVLRSCISDRFDHGCILYAH